jgi:hypothetical protein
VPYVLKGCKDSFWVSDSYWYGALKLASAAGNWEPAGTSLWDEYRDGEYLDVPLDVTDTYIVQDNQTFYTADAKRFGRALLDALQDVPDEIVKGDNLLQMLSGAVKKNNLKRIAQMAIDGEFIIGPEKPKE